MFSLKADSKVNELYIGRSLDGRWGCYLAIEIGEKTDYTTSFLIAHALASSELMSEL